MKFNNIFLSLFILLSVFTISKSANPDCVYAVYVQTSGKFKADTTSKVSLALYDASGPPGVKIDDLVEWGGRMGPDYTYFKRGQLDIFTNKAQCLTGPVCKMNLTSSGTGRKPAWFVNYVQVTTTGILKQCAQKYFTVEQWLAKDKEPYNLTAIKNECLSDDKNNLIDRKEYLSKISVI